MNVTYEFILVLKVGKQKHYLIENKLMNLMIFSVSSFFLTISGERYFLSVKIHVAHTHFHELVLSIYLKYIYISENSMLNYFLKIKFLVDFKSLHYFTYTFRTKLGPSNFVLNEHGKHFFLSLTNNYFYFYNQHSWIFFWRDCYSL